MGLNPSLERLRREIDDLAGPADDDLETRYTLQRPPRPPGLYWQMRWLAGKILRFLRAKGLLPDNPWPVALAHSRTRPRARPLIVWGLGTDRSMLRKACSDLADPLAALPNFAPVLITDLADFAFFSRLGWLVEYVPTISGAGPSYGDRKLRFLARLYRDAPAVPASLGLQTPGEITAQLRSVIGEI